MNKDIFSVRNQIVLVSGASNGNGQALAKGFLSFGAKVILLDKVEPDQTLINNYKDNSYFIKLDLSETDSIPTVVKKIEKDFGGIDVLINNAGITLPKSDNDADLKNRMDIWEKTLRINLEAPYRLSELVAPIMAKKKKGVIINITSLGADLAFPDNPSYQASKAGLKQLSKALAMDYSGYGIRVNAICPGYIKTDMTKKSYSTKNLKEAREKRTILGRWGEPDDLIGAAIFLASDASAYITGIEIAVDGGWKAKGL